MNDAHPAHLTESEWDLLQVLWRQGPCTAREAAEALADSRAWAYSTVKTLLDRMRAKELVSARQVGNVWEYTAVLDREQAQRGAWRRFLERAFEGAMSPALEFIAGDARLTRKQREQLRRMLDEGDTRRD